MRDDGIGFEPAAVPGRGAEGGFGLTAMRQRVQRLAGRLEVESEPGAGTAVSARDPGGRPRVSAPIRLLIVDDHPVVRDGLKGRFTGDPDFEALAEAANGHDALTQAVALEPDVVLMDLRMPGGDGVTAIRRMAERGLRARVLVLTTYDTDRDVVPAIEAGATGYLLKDTPQDELFRAVRAAARGGDAVALRGDAAAGSGAQPGPGAPEPA